jgi:hypothetical protein
VTETTVSSPPTLAATASKPSVESRLKQTNGGRSSADALADAQGYVFLFDSLSGTASGLTKIAQHLRR